jgi:YidC/Oxa1 family membrane protein insertase
MNFDRNTIIGFVLLGVLLVGYLWISTKQQAEARKKQALQDSIAKVNKPNLAPDTVTLKIDSLKKDTTKLQQGGGEFQLGSGPEQTTVLENDVLKITFTSKGGQPKKIELKKFKGLDSNLLRLASSEFDRIDYSINAANKGVAISELNFQRDSVYTEADKSQVITYTLRTDSLGSAIHHRFTIRPENYMVDFNVVINGADKLLTQGVMNLSWRYTAMRQESDLSFEKQNTQVGYVEDDEFDYHTVGRRSSVEFDKPVKWIGVRQRFFNTFLVAKNNFSSGKMQWEMPKDDKTVVQSTANMQLKLPIATTDSASFGILYGPADFHVLKKYDMRFEKLINLGQGAYAFVRPLNRFIILPIFDAIKSLAGSMGLAIALLTIFIRLITSPLMYPGYKTSAQMRLLRPDLAKLKEKYPDDQQQYAMEQMKFLREAGVNQFAGCLPALVQIPIFFALYSFFNSEVAFRGQSFLWANDLSAFDDVIKFGFKIPLLGSHLSLFTVTATLTSFLISIYSMSMTPDQSNPVLKYMPYIFPVFLLFIFNNLPSALTWYYTVSNVITLLLQFVIQNYIIDHDKILAKIELNRKKPKTKSKWQERMEQMQQQQKKMKEMQQKNKK